MDEINTLQQRIKKIREINKLSQTEFGKKLEVCKSSIINYENGKRVPDAIFLINIIKNFSISPRWLLLGKGCMFNEKISKHNNQEEMDDCLSKMIEHLHIPTMKLALMAEYNRLKKIFKPLIDEYEKNNFKREDMG